MKLQRRREMQKDGFLQRCGPARASVVPHIPMVCWLGGGGE